MTFDDLAVHIAETYRRAIRDKDLIAHQNLYHFSVSTEIKGDHYIVYFDLPTYFRYTERGVNGVGGIVNGVQVTGQVGGFYNFANDKVSKKMAEAIADWIRVKPGIKAGKRDLKHPDRIAYAIAKGIKRKGIEPRNALSEALNECDDDINTAVMDLIINEVQTVWDMWEEPVTKK